MSHLLKEIPTKPGKVELRFSLAVSRDFVLGFLGILILGGFLLMQPTEVTSDGTRYLWGAKFLSEGRGYVTYGMGLEELTPQIDYPPLLSLLTAAIMKVSGLSEVYSLRVVNFLSLQVYYFSCCGLLAALFPKRRDRLLGLLFVLLSPLVWRYLNVALSEMLFAALLALSLREVLRAERSDSLGRKEFFLFQAGAVTALLCLARYSGLLMALGYAVFLLGSRNLGARKKKALALGSFLLPVIVGVGGWYLRNQMLTGYFTFMETYPLRSHWADNLFFHEADFLRNLIESLLGYTTYRWAHKAWTYVPVVFFLMGVGIVVFSASGRRKALFEDLSLGSFVKLTLIAFGIYLAAHNILWFTHQIGQAPRYYLVLQPFLFLVALGLIRELRNFPALCLALFLGIGSLFHGTNLVKNVVHTLKRPASPIPGASFEAFRRSPWVFGLLHEKVKREDILLSNNPTFLSYVAARPCWGVKSVSTDTVLEAIRRTGGKVYMILDKEIPCLGPSRGDCMEFLEKLSFRIEGEDSFTIVVQWLLS